MNEIRPRYQFEDLTPEDLLNGIGTLGLRHGRGVIVPAPGHGPEVPLNWAIQEIELAARIGQAEEIQRHSTNAILNARRSLACLVDWYLERDLATLCGKPPRLANQKADFLVRRGIIDALTSRVLERAISVRHELEHQYKTPTLEAAEDLVELLRRTIYAIRSESDPAHGPWIFGIFLHSAGISAGEPHAEFNGWTGPIVFISRFVKPYWVGMILPTQCANAEVRRAYLKDFSVELLCELLSKLEGSCGKHHGGIDVLHSRALARAMNLE